MDKKDITIESLDATRMSEEDIRIWNETIAELENQNTKILEQQKYGEREVIR